MSARRVAIVTGSNCGVGFETALALASAPHYFRVILAVRSLAKGEAAAEAIRAKSSSAIVQPMQLDLLSFDSVAAFAKSFRREIGSVDVLVLNAGIGGMGIVPATTADGADQMYRANFVSHFLLTLLLEKNGARVADLFSMWDADGSGTVSKREFRKAMPLLGFDAPKKEIDALFDQFDPDGSGEVDYKELSKLLRRAKGRDG